MIISVDVDFNEIQMSHPYIWKQEMSIIFQIYVFMLMIDLHGQQSYDDQTL